MQKFLRSPLPRRMHSLPIISVAHQSGTLVVIDEPMLTHPNDSMPIVYIMIHSLLVSYILWVWSDVWYVAIIIMVLYRVFSLH